jgi:hypothetical protein
VLVPFLKDQAGSLGMKEKVSAAKHVAHARVKAIAF